MDFVIFVKSCARDRALHTAVRETWGAWHAFADIRFVLGAGNADPDQDELVLPSRDGYDYLWEKTRDANAWACDCGYKYAFHACLDTYVVVPRLVKLGQSCSAPYLGGMTPDGHLSGGAGYLLDERAMRALAESKWQPKWEDQAVYELLDHKGIRPTALDCFRGREPSPWDTETVSVHLGTSTGSLSAQMLYDCDRRFVEVFGDAC